MTNKYLKKRNGYEIDSFWYPRVTSICKIISKPGLERWLANQESFAAMERKRKKLTEWGSDIHDIIEKIFLGRLPRIRSDVKPSVDAFLEWFKKHKIKLVGIEKRLLSKEHLYTGTLDVLAEVDGRLGVLDVKTSREIWDDHFIQVGAYFNAYNESSRKKAETYWIMRVDQHQKCNLCGAEKRIKSGIAKINGGKRKCRHKWEKPVGTCELQEADNPHLYVDAFLSAKRLWEFSNRQWLSQIDNYPGRTRFSSMEQKQFELEFLNS